MIEAAGFYLKLSAPLKSATALLTSLGIAAFASHVFAWTPGTYTSPMPAKGFTVDADDRNDVLSFWHAIYQASEGYETRIGWTGNLNATNHDLGTGTVSNVFVRDVERRLNFFRALSGSIAHASVNTGAEVVIAAADTHKPDAPFPTKAEANQRSAYMMARAYMANDEARAASHLPPTNVIAWTKAAWNSNNHSNTTVGYFGPGAITAYMQENNAGSNGEDNSKVWHRRWLLFQSSSNYATGDTPGLVDLSQTDSHLKWRWPSNALYVWQHPAEVTIVGARFVSYPCAGYFPAPLNSKYWSVSHPNANFTNATVQVRNSANSLLSVTKISAASTGGPGDSTMVWQVAPSVAANYVTEDTTYRISITGITANPGSVVPPQLQYSVTLINPDQLTSDQSLTGNAAPPAAGLANYFFTRPANAEAIQVNVLEELNDAWVETAEDGAATSIINDSHPSYSFRTGAIGGLGLVNGLKSFRLTHAERYDLLLHGTPDQTLTINREILTNGAANSLLKFNYKKGYMSPSSTMVVEYTQNDGATWETLGTPITGVSTTTTDTSPLSWSGTFPLSTGAFKVRFRFYKSGTGSTFVHEESGNSAYATGIFFDNITTANCTWLKSRKNNDLAASADNFTLDGASAGYPGGLPPATKLHLRLRTKLGNRWFHYGPLKTVTPTTTPVPGFDGWLAYEYPTLTGGFAGSHAGDGVPNGIKYGFLQDPLVPSTARDEVSFSPSRARSTSGNFISIRRAANGIRDGVTAEWSETLAPDSWSTDGVTVDYSEADKAATATAPAGTGTRFLRWKVTAP